MFWIVFFYFGKTKFYDIFLRFFYIPTKLLKNIKSNQRLAKNSPLRTC